MNKNLIATTLLGQFISLVSAGVIIFLSAGGMDWWAAWGVIAVWLVWFVTLDAVMLRLHPDLMAERMTPPRGAKVWDRVLLSSIRLMELVRYLLAGFDRRYGWTDGFPLAIQLIAVGVCLLSTAVFTWAMASNAFFSQVVRIQTDRGHALATDGPYRYVRHPAYLATVLYELALSSLLASWWAILASGICAALFILRTLLEDRTLRAELAGYAEYARRVRYRLVPGIW